MNNIYKFKTKITSVELERKFLEGLKKDIDEYHKMWLKMYKDIGNTLNSGHNHIKSFPVKEFKNENNIKDNELIYILVLIEFFTNINNRINNLYWECLTFLKKEKYLITMITLRALIETCYFDIYISQKLTQKLNSNKIKEFVELLCRANFSQSEYSIPLASSAQNNFLIKKIISKFHGRKIHINDALRYYQKVDFKKFVQDYFFERKKTELNRSHLDHVCKSIIDFTNQWDIKVDFGEGNISRSQENYAYNRLCEIIHPTAIYFHNEKDLDVKSDFKGICNMAVTPMLLRMTTFSNELKIYILYTIFENNKEFIETFKNINN